VLNYNNFKVTELHYHTKSGKGKHVNTFCPTHRLSSYC